MFLRQKRLFRLVVKKSDHCRIYIKLDILTDSMVPTSSCSGMDHRFGSIWVQCQVQHHKGAVQITRVNLGIDLALSVQNGPFGPESEDKLVASRMVGKRFLPAIRYLILVVPR